MQLCLAAFLKGVCSATLPSLEVATPGAGKTTAVSSERIGKSKVQDSVHKLPECWSRSNTRCCFSLLDIGGGCLPFLSLGTHQVKRRNCRRHCLVDLCMVCGHLSDCWTVYSNIAVLKDFGASLLSIGLLVLSYRD